MNTAVTLGAAIAAFCGLAVTLSAGAGSSQNGGDTARFAVESTSGTAADEANDAFADFLQFVEGEWHSSLPLPDNRTLNIRLLAERGPTPTSALWKVFLKGSGDWKLHGQTMIWREGAADFCFSQVLEDGVAGGGTVAPVEGDAAHFRLDWHATTPDGSPQHMHLEKRREGDALIFTVYVVNEGADRERAFEVRYQRSDTTPKTEGAAAGSPPSAPH